MTEPNKLGRGRGRGRGRGAMQFVEPTKPGPQNTVQAVAEPNPDPVAVPRPVSEPQAQVKPIEDDLATVLAAQVSSLSLHSGSKEVEDFITPSNTDSEKKLNELAVSLYKRCQQDWQFAKTVALVCRHVLVSVENGVVMRTKLLQLMKADFENKNTLRCESEEKFLGCLAVLCQSLSKVRLATGEPMQPLVKPVLESVDLLLDNKATANEMTCAAKQLLACGPILQKENSYRMREVMQKARNCILDERGNKNSRLMLLDVIEASASDWTLHVD